ncbi:hypothetical protein [Leptospira harrisiae]|uniref:hypothetical protein n=1 Tax=Leptospira harrisiae TaxID=2023189 RepID=UPI000C2A15B6|nr:hypothetical protein [Leptospira harrisiae]PKA08652.1 hypothetical protein CH366_02450 [Leptospira harrisiae]
MSPIETKIQKLKSEFDNLSDLQIKYGATCILPSLIRGTVIEITELKKKELTKEIEILSVILSELNTEEIKSMKKAMRPPAVRLELLDEVIDGEEQFEAFIFDQVVERGNFEKCQRTLRLNREYVTRGSIYSKNKVESSEVIR